MQNTIVHRTTSTFRRSSSNRASFFYYAKLCIGILQRPCTHEYTFFYISNERFGITPPSDHHKGNVQTRLGIHRSSAGKVHTCTIAENEKKPSSKLGVGPDGAEAMALAGASGWAPHVAPHVSPQTVA